MTAVLNQQLRQALQNKYLTLDPLAQLEHLRSQSQLLLSIKQLLQKRKYINTQILSHNGFTSTPYSQLLDESITNSSEQVQLNFELDDLGTKSKLREEMESSSIQAALRDVQLHCGQETYEIVRQAVMANRAKEMFGLQRMTAKLIEERDELASQLLVLKMEKTNTERQMQKYKKIVSGVDEQKKTLKKKQDNLLKKQHQVFKLQASFAFKQKISLQLKKRYERLVGSYISNQAKIERMYEELYKIWALICDKVQSVDCGGNCWRKEAMRKAKEQLVEERKLIKEESSHLEREYEVMSIVSEQFKRIFHQPETGSGEKLPADNSESNIKTEKSIKLEQSDQVPRLLIKIQ